MPVSSTLRTSAPKSASSSEQKPPGRSLERSRTFTPSSGRVTVATPSAPSARRGSRGHLRLEAEHLAGLGYRRGAAADVLGHLPRLGDQVAVGAGHLAVGQVEVVLQAGADVAAEHERGAEQLPLV